MDKCTLAHNIIYYIYIRRHGGQTRTRLIIRHALCYIYFNWSRDRSLLFLTALALGRCTCSEIPVFVFRSFVLCRLSCFSSYPEMHFQLIAALILAAVVMLQIVSARRKYIWSTTVVLNPSQHVHNCSPIRSSPVQSTTSVCVHVRCRQNHRTSFHHCQDRSKCEFQMGRSTLRGSQIPLDQRCM